MSMSKHAKSPNGSFHPLSAPDFLPLPQLRDLQLQRLTAIVQRAYDRVALFRKRMDERGLTPQDLRTLDDIVKLPFAEKTDLRDTYPFGLFASPMKEIVRLHASSGTTGKPIVVAYTQEDVQVWTNVMLRSFAACGVHEGDIIQNAYGYGLFTGGLGAHYGAEALGATVIPISGGNTPRQLMVMKDFGVKAYDIYGLSEIIGPGVAMECQCQAGAHIFEDYFYPEIINLKTAKPCPDGEEGELVLTTLGKKAMPMIRYRTRDITALTSETCECGRTLRRIKRIGRRADDMFIIRGVNVYPSQIETALLKVEGALPHYQIVLTREKDLDVMEVQVEVTPEVFTDTVGALEQLQSQLSRSIESTVGVRANIRLVQPRTITRSEGKAKRVIDQRKM